MGLASVLTFLSKSKIAKASIIIFGIIVIIFAFALTITLKNKVISEKETHCIFTCSTKYLVDKTKIYSESNVCVSKCTKGYIY